MLFLVDLRHINADNAALQDAINHYYGFLLLKMLGGEKSAAADGTNHKGGVVHIHFTCATG